MAATVTLRLIEGFRRSVSGRDPVTSKNNVKTKRDSQQTRPMSYLSARNVYPYAVDFEASKIYFIETHEELPHNQAPFIWLALQTSAKHLIETNIGEFLSYLDTLDLPDEPDVIFIHHASRCGSTLLHKLLGSHPGVESFSEDLVLENFLETHADRAELSERLYRSLVRFIAFKFATAPARRLVFKVTGGRYDLFDKLVSLFPTAKHLYLTRDAIRISESWINVTPVEFRVDWLFTIVRRLRLYNWKLLRYSKTQSCFGRRGVVDDPYFAARKRNREGKPFNISVAEAWLLMVLIKDQFFSSRNGHPALLLLRYEDILSKESIRRLLDPFLEFDVADGVDAAQYRKHSQRGDSTESPRRYHTFNSREKQALANFGEIMSAMST